jgi:hypothetical protein
VGDAVVGGDIDATADDDARFMAAAAEELSLPCKPCLRLGFELSLPVEPELAP